MVESSIPDHIKNFFDCSICFEEYSIKQYPCTLKCGHTLCQPCILKLMNKANTIICPFDKKKLSLDILSANLAYLNLMSRIRNFYTGSKFELQAKAIVKFTKECRYFSRTGNCRFGENCKFIHKPAELNSDSSKSYSESLSGGYSIYDSYEDYEDYLQFDVFSDNSFYDSDYDEIENNSDSSDYW